MDGRMDRAQITELYRKHGPMVLRRARALLGDEQAAKDAMQEVFIRALKAGSEFRGESSPTTWLYRVTTNYCLNQMRDGARRRQLLSENAPPPDVAPADSPESRLGIAQVIARAPQEMREILVYYFVDHMNHEEIAALMGVSRRTVGNRLESFYALARQAFGEPAAAGAGEKPS
jgi:RNA polymerase sigma-70 factor (ECF subfamily)